MEQKKSGRRREYTDADLEQALTELIQPVPLGSFMVPGVHEIGKNLAKVTNRSQPYNPKFIYRNYGSMSEFYKAHGYEIIETNVSLAQMRTGIESNQQKQSFSNSAVLQEQYERGYRDAIKVIGKAALDGTLNDFLETT